jgi:hypothetical protein
MVKNAKFLGVVGFVKLSLLVIKQTTWNKEIINVNTLLNLEDYFLLYIVIKMFFNQP